MRWMTVEEIVESYADMLYRICVVILCNEQDAQDAVQETFCRYMEHSAKFHSKEHEKAWLIKVATNICRDMHRGRLRHPTSNIDDISEYCEMPEQSEVLAELMKLPDKLKAVIYLHYIEGYKTTEIAKLMGVTVNTIRKRLQRGRACLKISLSEDE
ncbi:MAG: RNA polymerase sigma factor [Lachnospiraceae bacterium]|nr:RNA polymerase sigma factor [Lachnospiraceae bacterium]MBD5465578.1 RNA polymerase sigma factor [Lachnospiraceae bacterium]